MAAVDGAVALIRLLLWPVSLIALAAASELFLEERAGREAAVRLAWKVFIVGAGVIVATMANLIVMASVVSGLDGALSWNQWTALARRVLGWLAVAGTLGLTIAAALDERSPLRSRRMRAFEWLLALVVVGTGGVAAVHFAMARRVINVVSDEPTTWGDLPAVAGGTIAALVVLFAVVAAVGHRLATRAWVRGWAERRVLGPLTGLAVAFAELHLWRAL